MQTRQVENTRNTRFGTNRGRLPCVFRRSQARAVCSRHALRKFVSENPRGRLPCRGSKRKIPMPHLNDTGIPTYLETKPYKAYCKGISNDFTTHCASLSSMNQYSE